MAQIETITNDAAAKPLTGACPSDPKPSEQPATSLPPDGPAALICADPLIISTPSNGLMGPIGLASVFGPQQPERPITFLSPLFWHCGERAAAARATAVRDHRARYPRHEFIYLGNTQQEVSLLLAAGADAFFANHNIFASEEMFRPLPDVPIEFDAIYNARPMLEKRHWLAADIESVAYLGYVGMGARAETRAIVAEALGRGPGHVFINPIVDGLPKAVYRPEVNRALARAAVGLCLSEVEGAMYSSIEYLLAGLTVVSTPSLGGRDVYFDPDYCIIADPTPRAVREAVDALRKRNIPHDYVRSRTLAKLAVDRHRFLAFVEEIKLRRGVARSYATEWTFSGAPFHRWRPVEDHARDFFGPD